MIRNSHWYTGPWLGLALTLAPWLLVGALWWVSAERHDADTRQRTAEREARAHASYCAALKALHRRLPKECIHAQPAE